MQKLVRYGGELLLKSGTIWMVTPTNHVNPGADLYCKGPLVFGEYRNIFPPNISEDQKKSYSYHLSAGPYGSGNE